jgi:hypothetical protein
MRTSLLALSFLLCSVATAGAKGSAVTKNDPWNPHHIDDLPYWLRESMLQAVQRRSEQANGVSA